MSQILVRGWLACAIAAGCGNGVTSVGPDASVVAGDGSNTASPGLSVRWATEPVVIPGQVGGDITVSSLLFRVANLRMIGDAGPGDTRTSVDSIQLGWSAETVPATVRFGDAPTGLYSRIILLADGNQVSYSYEIGGIVKLDNVSTTFTIHDRSSLAISLETSTTLDPGKSAAITVKARIDQALQSLDFRQLAHVDGGLVLDTNDSAMSNFRNKMMTDVFESHDDGNL